MRQMVFAEFSRAASLEPACLGKSCGRRSHQPLIESKGRRQSNQAAERNGPTPRQDGITEQGHDERAASQRPLTAKARDELSGGGGSVIRHFSPLYSDCSI